MTSAAFGLGWHIWRRYRFFALAFLSYGAILAMGVPTIVRMHLHGVALAATIPLVLALFITISLFANRDGDIVGKDSAYPTYLLTLPVRTTELVLWPMLYCIGTVVLSWLALGHLILHPLGMALPLWWPALILAGMVAGIQAVFWVPLGLPYIRLALLLTVILLTVGLGIRGAALLAPWALTVLFFGVIALAYQVAVSGVARTRRGDTPEWRLGNEHAAGVLRVQKPFVSPEQAQFRYEWSRNGVLLPLLIAGLLLFSSGVLLRGHDRVPLDILHPLVPSDQEITGVDGIQVNIGVKLGLFFSLGVTPFLAMATGCGVRRPDTRKPDLNLNPFYAVRPLTSAAMVFAKFKMAACSTLVTWGIVLLFAFLILSRSAQDGATVAPLGLLLLRYVTLKTGVLTVLVLLAAMILTWKGQISGLFIELSGRMWIVTGYSILSAGLQTAFIMFLVLCSTRYPEVWPRLLRALPSAIVCAVLLKLSVAAWALHRCRQRHLIPGRTLAKIGFGWLAAAFGSWALLCLLLGRDLSMGGELLFGILLFLPLARPALAPLAMDWNRHR